MKFYKLRAIILILLTRLLAKILFVETPPIVAVTAIIKREKKLMFVNLTYMKGIGLPGGIVQKNEGIKEALIREVYEETGLKVLDAEYFTSSYSRFYGIPTLAIVFLVRAKGKIRSSEEGKIIWMEPRKALNKLAYKDNFYTIKKFLARV